MSTYDDWKTDPDYGRSHADLHRDELVAQITDERDHANKEIERLRSVLEEVYDECVDDYDVDDDDYGQVRPNKWMRLGQMIEEALKGRIL